MSKKTIGYVVRDATGENQISVRFAVLAYAQQFASQCAMQVRIWRVVTKSKAPTCCEIVDDLPCGQPATRYNPESRVSLCDEHGGDLPRYADSR